jgi:hypothetical protein
VAAGLYVPSFVHGHATHQLTRKIRRSKVSREHDPEFAERLAVAATRRFPEFQPDFVEGVIRWHNRVVGYALILVTDWYPPFRLREPEPRAA